jgi:hypothetical protein
MDTFVATVGASLVEGADNLPDLMALLEDVHEVGHDDVAVWQGSRLLLVLTRDGRRIDLAALWPPGCGSGHARGRESPYHRPPLRRLRGQVSAESRIGSKKCPAVD